MHQSNAGKINFKRIATDLLVTVAICAAATLLSLLFRHIGLAESNMIVVYILSALMISRLTKGYAYGIIASVLSMLSFNFFFIYPLYTLRVYDKNYIFTFIVMLVAALFTSTLTSKLLHMKELAGEREKQAAILNTITSTLVKTGGMHEVASVAAQCLSDLLECDVVFFVLLPKTSTVHKLMAERSSRSVRTEYVSIADMERSVLHAFPIPISVRNKIIGQICLPEKFRSGGTADNALLDSAILQITISMERELLNSEKEAARAETDREKFKSNLLRAISHDLRTPLAGITGSSEMLLQNLKNDENIKIAQGIYEDSCWLALLVENVLSLTKIQEGRLPLNIKSEAVEEIVSESVSRASRYTPNRKITTFVPTDVLFVPMDGKLIEQVLINLIDNALKHTDPEDEIRVTVYQNNGKAWFEVSNSGEGMNDEDLPRIFEMFYIPSRSHTDGKRGIGIGLAICKSIINYHGGEIYAENNPAGGMRFQFYLNLGEE